MNHAEYFKHYRTELGFRSQETASDFLSGKDIVPKIDYDYAGSLIERVGEIITNIDNKISILCRQETLETFIMSSVFDKFNKMKDSNIIKKLNNQGRRPEEVLFSWLRGSAIADYFEKTISIIFKTNKGSILKIGDDDISNENTFKRTAKADYIIVSNNIKFRLEIQSGFKGINDIKEHKVREARRNYLETTEATICMHIDLFNGQVAFVNISNIKGSNLNWVTRQQMEGQTVFSIDQNYFKWRLLDDIPNIDKLEVN